jgi:hypothetical protein
VKPATESRPGEEWWRRFTPSERVEISCGLFDAAVALFEATLPPDLDEYERKRRITAHFYGVEFADRVFPPKARSTAL